MREKKDLIVEPYSMIFNAKITHHHKSTFCKLHTIPDAANQVHGGEISIIQGTTISQW